MTTETATTAAPHISDIRVIMAEQLRALRNASPEALEAELKRSKAVSELSQTMINSAKVEIDFLQVTKQGHSPFLQAPASAQTETPPQPTAPQLQNNPSRNDDTKPVVTRTTWVNVANKTKAK